MMNSEEILLITLSFWPKVSCQKRIFFSFFLYLGKITFKKKTLIPHVYVYYLVFQKDSENYSMEIDEFGDDTDVFVKVSERYLK